VFLVAIVAVRFAFQLMVCTKNAREVSIVPIMHLGETAFRSLGTVNRSEQKHIRHSGVAIRFG